MHSVNDEGPFVAPGVLRRLVPFTMLIAITILTAFLDQDANQVAFALAIPGILVMFGAAAFLPWERYPRRAQGLLVVAAVLMFSVLIAFDGGLSSHYLVLLVVPVLWLAMYDSARVLALGIWAGVGGILVVTVISQPTIEDLFRGVTVIAVLVAVIPPVRRLVAANRQALLALAEAAEFDPLTRLVNRRGLERRALPIFQSGGPPVAAILIDVDHFKSVNDSLGHDAGDELVVQIGERLAAITRREDVAARIGGDEFLVITAGDRTAVTEVAKRIRTQLCGTYQLNGTSIDVTVSVGVSDESDATVDTRSLTKSADAAMYVDKLARARRKPHLVTGTGLVT